MHGYKQRSLYVENSLGLVPVFIPTLLTLHYIDGLNRVWSQ